MTDQPSTGLRDRIAEALLDHLSQTADIRPGRDGALAFMPEVTDEERMRIADAVLAVLPPPTDRAAVLLEVADWLKVWRPEFFERWAVAEQDRYEDGVDDAADELRRLAAEAQPAVFAECGHPKDAHREGDDPVSPGRCTVCADDDAWHDYKPTDEVRRQAEAQQQTLEETGAALAQLIADRPISELQAAIRILGWPPLRLKAFKDHGTQQQPVRHAPGRAVLCPDCSAKGRTVCTDAAAPVQPAAADNSEEADAIRLDEDGRDVETGHLPGCASQSYPDPGICYCEETSRG
jgi:hypothetical protein